MINERMKWTVEYKELDIEKVLIQKAQTTHKKGEKEPQQEVEEEEEVEHAKKRQKIDRQVRERGGGQGNKRNRGEEEDTGEEERKRERKDRRIDRELEGGRKSNEAKDGPTKTQRYGEKRLLRNTGGIQRCFSG